jgi:hypothetical protein
MSCLLLSANHYLVGIGAFAQNVDAPEAADTARVVARALEVNSTTSAADSACTACTMLSGSIYPAPSAVSVTTTVDAATATATATSNVSVTPISTETRYVLRASPNLTVKRSTLLTNFQHQRLVLHGSRDRDCDHHHSGHRRCHHWHCQR